MLYEILESFKGSQTGASTEQFTAGTQAELSDYLVSCVPADWIRPVKSVEIANKAVVSDGTSHGKKQKSGR
ncbi:MAG: hypothetical protein NUV51_05690 [Sulfuricaulis sp.]|nr:hypothetical protein [Sulfuricaulis sp.]